MLGEKVLAVEGLLLLLVWFIKVRIISSSFSDEPCASLVRAAGIHWLSVYKGNKEYCALLCFENVDESSIIVSSTSGTPPPLGRKEGIKLVVEFGELICTCNSLLMESKKNSTKVK